MLPSGYVLANNLGGQNCYFDTGVQPSNDLNITGLFYFGVPSGSYTAYLFGARNTNSTSSAGQFNFSTTGQGNPSYLGFGSARVTLSDFGTGLIQIKNNLNEFDINNGYALHELTGSTSSFTGTRTMYLLALNNAGSVLYGSGASSCHITVCEFSMEKNGSEIHHYVPVFDENNSRFCLYDLVTETVLLNQGTGNFYTHYLLETVSNGGGDAWIMTDTLGYVDRKYIDGEGGNPERLVAIPRQGYEFLNWTDSNGNVLSNDEYFEYRESGLHIVSSDTVITANFVKKTSEVQENHYQLLGLQYGEGKTSSTSPNGNMSDIYAYVRNFNCVKDSLTRSTTTIELEEVPSVFQVDVPVFLYNPRGKIIWCGIIKAINGNTLTCGEPTSFFDLDIVFLPTISSLTYFTVYSGIYGYVGQSLLDGYGSTDAVSAPVNPALKRRSKVLMDNFASGMTIYDSMIVFGETVYNLPKVTDTSIANVEDYLFLMSKEFGVIYEPLLYDYVNTSYPQKGVKHLLFIRYANPTKYGTIELSDNMEAISNLNITEENNSSNSLMIFNSTGTTLRGVYGVKNDGSIAEMSTLTSDFLAYDGCVNTVIMSDEKLKGLIRANLGNARLNHKITFDVDLNSSLLRFEDFKLGRRVNFYHGDKLYNSVVTGLTYSYSPNDIRTMTVTLGNVRTKLTAKINLGKTK